MIRYTKGNLLEAKTDALVNTVNTVGVMGKGVALMFKDAFPENYRDYLAAAKGKEVRIGKMFVTERPTLAGPRWIINFPTKQHWRGKSRLLWIEEGLHDLHRVICQNGIRSVAVPPLGCGNGGLDWAVVCPLIERELRDLENVEIVIYEPTDEYQNVAKRKGLQKLTPARALIAELVRRYWILGMDCSLLEIQKLAWFLERAILEMDLENPLNLRFEADRYGPYSDRLRHLLNGLDGSYLHSAVRIADAKPFDVITFDDTKKDRVTAYLQSEAKHYVPALNRTSERIAGFESPLGMELLGTIDWLLVRENVSTDVGAMKLALEKWPGGADAGARKLRIFDDRMIRLALERLAGPSNQANPA